MTAVQEQAIMNKIINNIERMDDRAKITILKISMNLVFDENDLEDILAEESDLEAIAEAEEEFAKGEEYVMEI